MIVYMPAVHVRFSSRPRCHKPVLVTSPNLPTLHRPTKFGWIRLKMEFRVQVYFGEHVLCGIGGFHLTGKLCIQIINRGDELSLTDRPLEVLPPLPRNACRRTTAGNSGYEALVHSERRIEHVCIGGSIVARP